MKRRIIEYAVKNPHGLTIAGISGALKESESLVFDKIKEIDREQKGIFNIQNTTSATAYEPIEFELDKYHKNYIDDYLVRIGE